MPLRTAKPTVRIDTLPDRYTITFYPVYNRQLVKPNRVSAPKDDYAAFTEIVDKLIRDTRAEWGFMGK